MEGNLELWAEINPLTPKFVFSAHIFTATGKETKTLAHTKQVTCYTKMLSIEMDRVFSEFMGQGKQA